MTLFLTKKERQSLAAVLKLLKIKPGGFLLALLLGVAALGAAVGLSATSAWLIARASQQPPVLYLSVAAVSVRFFGISRAVFRYLQRIASHKVALSGMDNLRIGIYDHLTDGSPAKAAGLKRGELLARTGADVDTVGDLIVKSLLPALVTLIVALGTIIGFALLSVPAALVLLACMLLSAVVAPLLVMRSTRLGEIAQVDANHRLSVTTMTILDGASELQVDGRYPHLLHQFDADCERLNVSHSQAARPAALAAALDRLAMGLAVIGVILVAGPQVQFGAVAAVAFAVLVLTPLAAFEGTSELAAAAAQLVRSAQAALRIHELISDGDAVRPKDALPLPTNDTQELQAKDLSVGWPKGDVLLQNLNLEVRPGSTTAIVGPSGIGKTTLLYTLDGILPAKEGGVTIGGINVWEANRQDLTKQISLTTEDAHVFATTVYENLRVGNPELSREEAATTLTRMGLGEWLDDLPHGLDTQLGSGGTTVSGGERRRLLLARALADPAPIMLLDEPGEHLDPEAARKIMGELLEGEKESGESQLSETKSKRAIVLVTHQLSQLGAVDQGIVIGKTSGPAGAKQPAEVVAQGSHSDLISESAYYRHALEQEQ